MTTIRLRYGRTNTFLVRGEHGNLLVDTDWAGTLSSFYKAAKHEGMGVKDIDYVLATHYHPDHMGLISELMTQGVNLLVMDVQQDFVHFSDSIFAKEHTPYTPIDDTLATVISCKESRGFLERLGISGEIIHTPSHSEDSICLVLDGGDCFVGDLQPYEYREFYGKCSPLWTDWNSVLSFHPKRILYAHVPEKRLEPDT